MGDPAERRSVQSKVDECEHCSREHRKNYKTNEGTGWRFGETHHRVREWRKILEGVEMIKQEGMGKKVLISFLNKYLMYMNINVE